jgi:cobalt-zinc-cadmium resistance protein CzcA
LIEHFKELKHQGMKSIDELILKEPLTDCVPFDRFRSCLGFFTHGTIFCRGGGTDLSDGSYWWTFTATILTMVVPVLFKVFWKRI